MHKRIIVALDFPCAEDAIQFVQHLDPGSCRLKVGFELFISAGPELVKMLRERGFEIFLDLKLHDIPNTVAAACRAAASLGVWMLNVHASGGRDMLEAAKNSLAHIENPPKLVAVTVLTSLVDNDLLDIGVQRKASEHALELAQLVSAAGLDGVVCSAQEAPLLRQKLGNQFVLVTPGIRLKESASHDQKRVMTPIEAVRSGSDYLVIGRPITRAKDPMAVLKSTHAQIIQAL